MSRNYKFHNKSGLNFVSFATAYGVRSFYETNLFYVLAESIGFCKAKKGMKLYAHYFIPSHVHFIFRSNNDSIYGLLRDFKSFAVKKRIEAIETNPQEIFKTMRF